MASENLVNPQANPLHNKQRDILSSNESFRPKTASATVSSNQAPSQEKNLISPSKRQALDALLQEIAKRKSETK